MLSSLLLLACAPTTDGASSIDSGTDTSAPVTPLQLSEPQPCATPTTARWSEVGAALGLVGADDDSAGPQLDGGGLGIDDFDDDGDLDLLVGFAEGPALVFWREGDGWRLETAEAISRIITVNLADLDGDGRRELLLGREGNPLVYRTGGASVSDWRAVALPSWELENNVKELAPSDINGDGWVDLYALVRGGSDDLSKKEDAVLWGSADGFVLDREAVPEGVRYRHGFDAAWFDWDADGDLDLYVANDLGASYGADALLENRDGALVDASAECGCDIAHTGMSVAADDFSGDGRPDLYVSDAYVNLLLQSLDDGSYVNVAQSQEATLASDSVYMTWGAIFTDLDNDGARDLLAARGDYDREAIADVSTPTALLGGQPTWRDESAALGLVGEGIFRSVAALDLNADGLVDPLFVQARARPLLFLSQGCSADGWLEFEGPEGARVEVTTLSGEDEVTQTTWLTSQSGLGVATPPIAHVGLGDAQTVERLRVLLLDGQVLTLDAPFEARRRVLITP